VHDGKATTAGKVTLKGAAETQASKELVARMALNTNGVIAVSNQLVVTPAKPSITDQAKSTTVEAGRELSDSWITTKVKLTLLYSSNVSGADVVVNTQTGVVTLTGKVASAAERALAVELAANVRGVKNVNAQGLAI
jgi:hyperosmotically inducible protein